MVKTAAIVSLSAGTIGESFVAHEVVLGEKVLNNLGINVKYMPHAKSGIAFVKEHPEARADDLIAAFEDVETDMILCAIGGDDTYRLLPYLFENDRLKNALQGKNKIFLGFSDTTFNHLMLHRLGFKSFYGQSFLADVCELEGDMLPYSKKHFTELVTTGGIKEICPSDVWYEERTDWSVPVGTPRISHPNSGFKLLQGPSVFEGEILGGCLDSIYDMFDTSRYSDTVALCEKYSLFPSADEWKGKILLLETSEEQPSPEKYRRGLEYLKSAGVFDNISGILCGKPMDEKYYKEYCSIICEVADNPSLPILANINTGHATPRCIIPFGVHAVVDAEKQLIKFG